MISLFWAFGGTVPPSNCTYDISIYISCLYSWSIFCLNLVLLYNTQLQINSWTLLNLYLPISVNGCAWMINDHLYWFPHLFLVLFVLPPLINVWFVLWSIFLFSASNTASSFISVHQQSKYVITYFDIIWHPLLTLKNRTKITPAIVSASFNQFTTIFMAW